MSESVELRIQISTPTTPRHHRDEELPVANVRICRTVCTDQQLVNSSNIENLRIYKTVDTSAASVRIYTTVDTNRPRMCNLKNTMSESIELLLKNKVGVECHVERIVAVRIKET